MTELEVLQLIQSLLENQELYNIAFMDLGSLISGFMAAITFSVGFKA